MSGENDAVSRREESLRSPARLRFGPQSPLEFRPQKQLSFLFPPHIFPKMSIPKVQQAVVSPPRSISARRTIVTLTKSVRTDLRRTQRTLLRPQRSSRRPAVAAQARRGTRQGSSLFPHISEPTANLCIELISLAVSLSSRSPESVTPIFTPTREIGPLPRNFPLSEATKEPAISSPSEVSPAVPAVRTVQD